MGGHVCIAACAAWQHAAAPSHTDRSLAHCPPAADEKKAKKRARVASVAASRAKRESKQVGRATGGACLQRSCACLQLFCSSAMACMQCRPQPGTCVPCGLLPSLAAAPASAGARPHLFSCSNAIDCARSPCAAAALLCSLPAQVPALIFQLEEYERQLIRINKAANGAPACAPCSRCQPLRAAPGRFAPSRP